MRKVKKRIHGKIVIDDLVTNLEDIEVKVIDFKDCRLLIWKVPKKEVKV